MRESERARERPVEQAGKQAGRRVGRRSETTADCYGYRGGEERYCDGCEESVVLDDLSCLLASALFSPFTKNQGTSLQLDLLKE